MAAVQCVCPPILKVVGKDYPVPLTSISVELAINGFVANVESVLHFKNTETNPIEAVYEFPLDDQSAVYRFEAQIEDRTIVAECQPKKEAKQTYEDAINAGQTATLMEEDDSASDIFRCLLGNLPAGVEAIVKFAYVIELPLTPEGALQYVLPTQLNPRYNPSLEKGGTSKPVDVPYIMPGGDQPYKFNFRATVFHTGKISSIKSGSEKDEISVTLRDDNQKAEVSLVNSFVADHDFSLQVSYLEAVTPHVIIEKGDPQKDGILKQDVIMLNFFPQLADSAFSNKHEFLFVIDRSGSMDGPRIHSAKTALMVFLKSLPPGCYFNIIGFGSTFALLFPDGSREYSEETLKLACDYQENLAADFGGTEILEPLRAIYAKQPMSTHSRQILILTDGEVSNTQAVIDLVRTNVSSARVFSFGIGEGASTSLVKGVARAGRGKAEFVLQDDQITSLVMKTLKAAMQASVTDLHLDWEIGGNAKLVQVPRDLPALFAGDRLIVYAFNSGEQSLLDGRIRLKGKVGEQSIDFAVDVNSTNDTCQQQSALPIHRLAAKAEIKNLQDKEENDKNKADITVLSIAANVISKHTSMVGVDLKSKQTVAESMVQRNVPLMMSPFSAYALGAGAGGYLRSAPMMCAMSMPMYGGGAPVAMKCCAADPPLPRVRLRMTAKTISARAAPARAFDCATESLSLDAACMACDDAMECEDNSVAGPTTAAPVTYVSVVSLQTFNGSWKLDDKLADLTAGLSKQQLTDAAPIKSPDVWATVIALALLASKFADKKDEWEMIAMKARQWLGTQPLEDRSIEDLVQLAVQLLNQAA